LNWAGSVALAAASNQFIGKDRSDRGNDVDVLVVRYGPRERTAQFVDLKRRQLPVLS
jgi:hypothetical protein